MSVLKSAFSVLFLLWSPLTLASSHADEEYDNLPNTPIEGNQARAIRAVKKHLVRVPWDGSVLLVIDMQPDFQAAQLKRVQKNIKREIQKAMELQQLIIYAEYLKGGPTFRYLTDLTDGYTRKLVLIKEEDSAHKALQTMKEELDLQKFSNIRVCGVNTDACVYRTVRDLCAENILTEGVTLVEKACNGKKEGDHNIGLLLLQQDIALNRIRGLEFEFEI